MSSQLRINFTEFLVSCLTVGKIYSYRQFPLIKIPNLSVPITSWNAVQLTFSTLYWLISIIWFKGSTLFLLLSQNFFFISGRRIVNSRQGLTSRENTTVKIEVEEITGAIWENRISLLLHQDIFVNSLSLSLSLSSLRILNIFGVFLFVKQTISVL